MLLHLITFWVHQQQYVTQQRQDVNWSNFIIITNKSNYNEPRENSALLPKKTNELHFGKSGLYS